VPRRWRWLIAAPVWILPNALGLYALLVDAQLLGGLFYAVVVTGLQLPAAMLVAAWINRRPGHSAHTAILHFVLTLAAGPGALAVAINVLGAMDLPPDNAPDAQWHPMRALMWLATYVGAGLVSLVPTFVLLAPWCGMRERVSIVLATLVAAVIVVLTLPDLSAFTSNAIAWWVFAELAALSGAILVWACIAPPCAREWEWQCPVCRYDVTGLQTPRCPECGCEFVRPSQPASTMLPPIEPPSPHSPA
jgi:hypothetical protein